MTSHTVQVRRFALVATLLFSMVATGCASKSNAEQPCLRIRNAGSSAVEGLVVIFPEDRIEFGDVAPEATTSCKAVPHGVYRYAAYELELDGERIQQPVVDWVGETPMSGTHFTYAIALDPSAPRRNMVRLVEVTGDR